MTRLWDKGVPLDARVLEYTAGEDYLLDERLVVHDVRASIAHAQMLHAQQLLSAADLTAISDALTRLAAEHARGEWRIELADEDGQTALERRLTARIGAAGARIHLGRSRNDQVLTAIRLYLREAVGTLSDGALSVAAALDALGAREANTVLPGYTHLQQAMPSSVALWAGGFAAEVRDGLAVKTGRLMFSGPQLWCIAPGPCGCQEAVYQHRLLAGRSFLCLVGGRPVLFGGRLDKRRELRDDSRDYRL